MTLTMTDAQTLTDYLVSVIVRMEGVESVHQWKKHAPPTIEVVWLDGTLSHIEVSEP